MGQSGRFTHVMIYWTVWDRFVQVLYLSRAPCTKETLPDFLKWRWVTRHTLVFHGLTGSQQTPGFGASHNLYAQNSDGKGTYPIHRASKATKSTIKEVVKKEVLKWLQARFIYAIFDSPWVSFVQVVPKR